MDYQIERTPQARRDLVDLANFIAKDSLDAARRFLDAAEATFEFLASNRTVGQHCEFTGSELTGMRVWPIERFKNHLVFFRPTDAGIQILRVLHGARNIEALFTEHQP